MKRNKVPRRVIIILNSTFKRNVWLIENIQFKNNLKYCWTSLVGQWIRIRLPRQGKQVRALVWEDFTCHRAAGPLRHNYWAHALEPSNHNFWAHVLQLPKPVCLEPVLCNKEDTAVRSLSTATKSSPHLSATGKAHSNEDPTQPKIKIILKNICMSFGLLLSKKEKNACLLIHRVGSDFLTWHHHHPHAPTHTDTQIHKPHIHTSLPYTPTTCIHVSHTYTHTQPVGGEDWLNLFFLPSLLGCGILNSFGHY